jgi:ADP-ribose pyrophosphatase
MPLEPEVPLSKETIYEGKIFSVYKEKVRLPDGNERPREIVVHPGAVALVVVDDEGKIILVRQYRRAAGKVLLEVPAGTRDHNEDPESTAHREIQEETGYKANKLKKLGGFYSAPGFCTEYLHCYLMTGLEESRLIADDDETFEMVRLSPDEALQAIRSGEIEDAKSICAIMLWLDRRR